MNKLLEIFFRYILPERIRYKYYFRDIETLDKRHPYYEGISVEEIQYAVDSREEVRKYWRISYD